MKNYALHMYKNACVLATFRGSDDTGVSSLWSRLLKKGSIKLLGFHRFDYYQNNIIL